MLAAVTLRLVRFRIVSRVSYTSMICVVYTVLLVLCKNQLHLMVVNHEYHWLIHQAISDNRLPVCAHPSPRYRENPSFFVFRPSFVNQQNYTNRSNHTKFL